MELETVTLELTGSNQDEGWIEPIAGGLLWCDLALRPGGARSPRPPGETLPDGSVLTLVYDGPGLVDGGVQRIRSFIGANGTRRVELEDGESFTIAAAGDRITRLAAGPDSEPGPRTVERALGAPLALALALRGTFLLHASAILGERGVIALAAESGVGKSTLAAAAADMTDLGFVRIADDLLPARLDSSPYALPHFPQLKLPPEKWYPSEAAAALPLAMLVELDRGPDPPDPSADSPVRLECLDAAAAFIVLVRATVASRLLDPDLLARHFQACAMASKSLQVCRLHYPSGLHRLREPLAALAAGRMSSGSPRI